MNTQTYSFHACFSHLCALVLICFLSLTTTGCGLIDLDELLDGECSSLNPECEEPTYPIEPNPEPSEPWICVEGDYFYDDYACEECYCDEGEWYCGIVCMYEEDSEDYPLISSPREDEEYDGVQPEYEEDEGELEEEAEESEEEESEVEEWSHWL